MTRLSVNINKVATLRNARGGNNPDVVKTAIDLEEMGAEGITVHPRPDERFTDIVMQVRPAQVTLVPDAPDQLTSNHGWDTTHPDNIVTLTPIVRKFKEAGIRVSIFVDADPKMVEGAAALGADRVELYTEPYASNYGKDKAKAVEPFVVAARKARELGIGLNAGHDLSLENLQYLHEQIPWIDEVSIGHALICDALYLGFRDTIKRYKECLK